MIPASPVTLFCIIGILLRHTSCKRHIATFVSIDMQTQNATKFYQETHCFESEQSTLLSRELSPSGRRPI